MTDPSTTVNIVNQAAWLGSMFTFLAGVVGSLIAGGFVLWNEKRKRSEESKKSEDTKEHDGCMKFLESVNQFYDRAHYIKDGVVPDEVEINSRWAELQVVAHPNLVECGGRLINATYGLVNVVKDLLPEDDIHTDDNVRRYENAYLYERMELMNELRARSNKSPLSNPWADDDLPAMPGGVMIGARGEMITVPNQPYLKRSSHGSPVDRRG